MTDDRKSLNLIQRALDRKMGLESMAPAPAAVAPQPVLEASPAVTRLKPAPAIVEPRAPEVEIAPVSPARVARLNMGALRRSGMINPEIKTSTIANEFRAIKRKILLSARDKKSRELINNLIMVTSTMPAEGKTFTSMNLALSLAAERDVQVLLMDSDLHRPSIGRFFENSKPDGLSDLLTDHKKTVQDVVYRCDTVPNLSVLFAGRHVDDSPELIASTRMRDLLMEISERYRDRIVVIDTPPALTTFEPAILASHVHQTVMVVSSQHAGRHQIEKALDSISACHNISLLFNKAPKWEQKDGGYYYNYDARPEGSVA
jgi:receptor protein-tyrosine kinase